MEFQELIRQRYSVRAYKPERVDRAKLDRVLEAAILAPTAANRQPFRLLVIKTAGRAQELRRIYRAEWFAQAPLVICACGLSEEGWTRSDGKDYTDVDVAIAMDHLILAAVNEGLGTCWIGAFDAEAARDVLDLPEGVEPIAFTPLGYPDDLPRPKRRRPAAELVKYETW
jgi:nitroreductase